MKLPILPRRIPMLMLSCGVVGFGLHLWMLSAGTDATGLLLPGHPAGIALMVLTAAALVLLVLHIRPLATPPAYGKLFPQSKAAAIGCAVAALGFLYSGLQELILKKDAITIISCLLSMVCAGSALFTGYCRLKKVRPNPAFNGIVTAYLILHLICQYRSWSAQPQVLVYFFPLLASVFLMMASYYRTSLDADDACLQQYAFFQFGALFFCCVSVYDASAPFYLAMAIWIATTDCRLRMKKRIQAMPLPEDVLFCIDTLEAAGHSAFAVGGCVRDFLLGLTPDDYDLCTSATPEQMHEIFADHELVCNGEKHGTVGVIRNGHVYEITTFRKEGTYADTRHPDWVDFVTNVEEDLARRDFTINAIAYSPAKGYVDPQGGQADLRNGVLRAVGDPDLRFAEDALRILRGVRFAVKYRLTPEETTLSAMLSEANLMENLAKERIFTELCKLLPHVTAADLTRYAPVMTQIIPELTATVGFQQHSPHHAYDVYTHTAHVVESVPPDVVLRLAALLHDIGKPSVFTRDEDGRGHFYGHAKAGAEMANEILLRLKSPTVLREKVVFLIEHHMTALVPDKKLLRKQLSKYGEDSVEQLLLLQKADFGSKGVDDEEDAAFVLVDGLLEEIRTEGTCLTVKDLAISGRDLLDLGLEPGPHIGTCMTFLLSLVHDDLVFNTKDDLLVAAKEFFEQGKGDTEQ